MSAGAEPLNQVLQRDAPALWACLSHLGRRAFYPPDIPFQAQQAKGKTYNATIGQITDGAGHILALPSVAAALGALSAEDVNRALLYSPMEGIPELRELWDRWQRPADARPASLPIVTCGLAHGLGLCADLFGGPERKVIVPTPFWGNYRQTFAIRTGSEILPAPAYEGRRWLPRAIAERASALPAGEPAVAILNLPSNPGGYSPTVAEREELIASLVEAAAARPLVVVCDDAYAGLVFEDDVPTRSVFWDLIDRHPNLIPIKASASTKEFVFFGGRVGFLTLPFARQSSVTQALEAKLKGLIRASLGSPVALSQVVLLQALRKPSIGDEVADAVSLMRERYRVLNAALARAEEECDRIQVLPCNSGVFALVALRGLEAEPIRQRLLADYDTGLVAIAPNYLRIAFCSIEKEAIPELVTRMVAAIEAAATEVAAIEAGSAAKAAANIGAS
jgi:aspartate/methionine/tyrosine aminotransferase